MVSGNNEYPMYSISQRFELAHTGDLRKCDTTGANSPVRRIVRDGSPWVEAQVLVQLLPRGRPS
ncbi:MAG: hypothetical protein AMS18_05485 [Gemmatimonas sp. SG8_17]|nr:MAG: hypothetical protein AMS18_05485 [Gemmatimonas sp. SG8_17]